jgi:hypothetical protein
MVNTISANSINIIGLVPLKMSSQQTKFCVSVVQSIYERANDGDTDVDAARENWLCNHQQKD